MNTLIATMIVAGTAFTGAPTPDKEPVALVASATDSLSLRYVYVWKGITVGVSNVTLERPAGSYRVAFDFRTKGPLSLFFDGEQVGEGEGLTLANGSLQPAWFTSSGEWDGKDYDREVRFDDQGIASLVRVVRPEKQKKKYPLEPVPEELKKGPDPMSVLVAMTDAGWKQEGDRSFRMTAFDGDRVMEHVFACDEATDTLPQKKRSIFTGDATACTWGASVKAGHLIETEKQKRKRLKREAKERRKAEKARKKGEDRTPKIWFADVEGTKISLPVRARFYSGWGAISVHLADFSAGRKPAQLVRNAAKKVDSPDS